jgi:hypothetical protein
MLHQQFERRAQYVVACGRRLFLPQGGFVRCHDSTLLQMAEYCQQENSLTYPFFRQTDESRRNNSFPPSGLGLID